MNKKSAIVIGSGFSGLSTACFLAKEGYKVQILEKNESIGGRARKFQEQGFVFDMGPSWYWMPDVFERFFNYFDKSASDYYELIRLDPSYKVVFGQNDELDIPADYNSFRELLENIEEGSAEKLDDFLSQAEYKYQVGINDLVYRPSNSITEFLSLKLLIDVVRLDVFQSFETHINKYFKSDKIKMLMEFPILFLGALAKSTPALYSLMNYADIKLGTWYPKGGMYKIIEGMEKLALELGVEITANAEVNNFLISQNLITGLTTSDGKNHHADVIIASADYNHVEQKLLPSQYRMYSNSYWDKRVMAPSSLIFYLGLNKKVKNLIHHNLFFDGDFTSHAKDIYTTPSWPENPLFYTCVPSKTDETVAPEGHENLFILMPVAPGIKDNEETREKYFKIILSRLEKYTGEELTSHIIYKKSYAHSDFMKDYHAFKGNAYGLANTLFQTAFLKPKIRNKKLTNLYFTGQLTVPGPGVPPSLISGKVVANEVIKDYK